MIFLPLEAYEVLTDENIRMPVELFLAIAIFIGIVYFIFDEYYLNGHLNRETEMEVEIEIQIPSSDSKIKVKFGDIFKESGWKAIGVNDFFDSTVDEKLVSSGSLHGQALNKYWPNDKSDWKKQVSASLQNKQVQEERRSRGNRRRYEIGTTARACTGEQKFLFVALSETDTANDVTSANVEMLIRAVRGMVAEARAACSMEPLVIPLMGSKLARVGIKNSVLVDLIITAIMEESRNGKVTDEIKIVLSEDKKGQINLKNYTRNWADGK